MLWVLSEGPQRAGSGDPGRRQRHRELDPAGRGPGSASVLGLGALCGGVSTLYLSSLLCSDLFSMGIRKAFS